MISGKVRTTISSVCYDPPLRGNHKAFWGRAIFRSNHSPSHVFFVCCSAVPCKQDYQQGIRCLNVESSLKSVFVITGYDYISVCLSGQSAESSYMLNKNILCIGTGCQ